MERPKRAAAPATPEQLARLREARQAALGALVQMQSFAVQLPAQLVAWDDAPVDFGDLTRECMRVAHDLAVFAAWAEEQTLP